MEINNKKEINLKQMSRVAISVSVALVLMLVIGIVVSNTTGLKQIKESTTVELGSVQEFALNVDEFFQIDEKQKEKVKVDVSTVDVTKAGDYEVTVTYNKKEYAITVIVEDTTVPKVSLSQRYIFTNDIASLSDFSAIVHEAKDASELTYKLVRFEKKKELVEVNDLELRNLTDGAVAYAKAEDALLIGTEEVPTQPGIYRSVLEIADVHGNASYEEVVVILDTMGAAITDVEDQTVTVAKDKLKDAPEVDKSLYSAADNVDGYIKGENLSYELSCRDEAKHEWIVKVSYADRAGNESAGEFLITVKEKKKAQNSTSGNKNNASASDAGNTSNDAANEGNTSSSESTDNGNFHPADTNKDGSVSTDEEMAYITPEKQACIDAGYGVVVEFDGGSWYAVLMKDSEHTIDGKDGHQILRDYLEERDLDCHTGGCWINPDNEWYWFIADEIRELISEEDEEYWG